jgi:3-oxoacyl-[acyl-carrier-protein] synthase-1
MRRGVGGVELVGAGRGFCAKVGSASASVPAPPIVLRPLTPPLALAYAAGRTGTPLKAAMSNSFGFGGTNCSLLFTSLGRL